MEIQKTSLLQVNVNQNKPVIQAQMSQNVDLPDVTIELGAETEHTNAEQSQQAQPSVFTTSVVEEVKPIDLSSTHLSFSIDENTNDMVINIIDSKSGEVIRSIPPEEILSMRKRLVEIQGLLFDKKA